jgi:hypothetical protein
MDAYSNLKALGTRIVNALSVSGVADSVIEGARTINRKLQGQRANGSSSAPSSLEKAGMRLQHQQLPCNSFIFTTEL